MSTNTYISSETLTSIALTIAGSDSGGGAGIQADLKAFAALGVYGCSAITSLTAQNTLGVQGVLPIPPEFVAAQIDSVLTDIHVGAIKTGMLATAEIINAVANTLINYPAIPFVLDPVMVATSGDRLLAKNAITALIKNLMPRATVITPNLFEAAALLDAPMAQTEAQIQHQAERLLAMGAQAVLMKGGHAQGAEANDFLFTHNEKFLFSAPRIATKNTHGTGCTLAAAITAGLARKLSLHDSVALAKDYLQNALLQSHKLNIGPGCGPVHHFYQFY